MQKLKAGGALLIGVMLLTGCSSDFMEEYSQDLSHVKSVDDLQELVIGDCVLPLSLFEYSNYYYSYENPNYMVLHFMGDELTENLNPSKKSDVMNAAENFFPYFTWQQSCNLDYQGNNSKESQEASFWNLGYEKIGKCNTVIDAADDVDANTDEELNTLHQALGDTYFLRAFYYFTLTNLYGKPYKPSSANTDLAVPIKLTAYIEDKEFTRNTVAECYEQILSDLNAAEEHLKQVQTSASIYHSSLAAIYILHSRVALYMQDWSQAQSYAKLALEQKSDLQDLSAWTTETTGYPISSDNPEVLFSNGASCFGNYIYASPQTKDRTWGSSSNQPAFIVDDHLVALYDDNDGRKSAYITNADDVSGNQYTYHKIDNSKDSYGVYKTASDVFCIRTAEAYLNLAEADAQLGNNEEACQYLTQLRAARIADASAVSLSGDELITFIREERERELCFEGHRWFDLRRYMVDASHPFSKAIEHTFTTYVYRDWANIKQTTAYYRLEPNDEAYTLDIPSTVRTFQNSIGSNPRPVRTAYNTVNYDSGGDDDEEEY
jgi:hypothetical protein